MARVHLHGIGRAVFAAAWSVLVLSACGGGGGDAARTGSGATASRDVTSSPAEASAPAVAVAGASETIRTFADQVLEAVNAARAVARKCGDVDFPAAPPLQWNAQTEQAAMVQAAYLQQNNLFSHTGANGSTVGDRLTATGYVWQTVGENIAAGYTELPAVVQGWLDSPGHCVNVMNSRFTHLGVSMLAGTSANTYRTYWGMVLARPR